MGTRAPAAEPAADALVRGAQEHKKLKQSKSMVSSGFKFITQVGAKAAAGANKYMDLEKHQKVRGGS
jgi:hypothetical protein